MILIRIELGWIEVDITQGVSKGFNIGTNEDVLKSEQTIATSIFLYRAQWRAPALSSAPSRSYAALTPNQGSRFSPTQLILCFLSSSHSSLLLRLRALQHRISKDRRSYVLCRSVGGPQVKTQKVVSVE